MRNKKPLFLNLLVVIYFNPGKIYIFQVPLFLMKEEESEEDTLEDLDNDEGDDFLEDFEEAD